MAALRSQKGILLIAFLPLILILCVSLVALMGFSSWLQYQFKTLSACREILVDAQIESAKFIEKLQTLNPEAKALRTKYQRALQNYYRALATGNPKVITAAKIYLNLVKVERAALAAKQKSIIAASHFSMSNGQRRAIQKIRSIHRPNQLIKLHLDSIYAKPFWLAVKPDLPSDVAPQYFLKQPFEAHQAASVIWKYSINSQEAVWKVNGFFSQLRKTTNCEVTLKKSSTSKDKTNFHTKVKMDRF